MVQKRAGKTIAGQIKKTVLGNAGMTLVEMVVSFLLLAIFMVAAARVISYTVGIYYGARGISCSQEVTDMIAGKTIGLLENAGTGNSFYLTDKNKNILTEGGQKLSTSGPLVYQGQEDAQGNRLDEIKFVDGGGSVVTIGTGELEAPAGGQETYLRIHYDQTPDEGDGAGYAAVDWVFDPKAYMGYSIRSLKMEKPGGEYADNVLKLTITVHSPKYGDFTSSYYIRCSQVDEVRYAM